MQTTSQWHFGEGYMNWFYFVSHLVMTSDPFGRPLRPAHEKIQDNEQVRDDHVVDVLTC